MSTRAKSPIQSTARIPKKSGLPDAARQNALELRPPRSGPNDLNEHSPPESRSDSSRSPLDLTPGSFFRPPEWRWRRAAIRSRTGTARFFDDDWVLRALNVHQAGRASRSIMNRIDPEIAAAFDIWNAGASVRRWQVEAYLMTAIPLRAVAAVCGEGLGAIIAFHELFFSVRPRLHARDWLVGRVIRCGAYNEFVGLNIGSLWKHVAMHAGAEALRRVIAVTLPDGDLSTSHPKSEDASLRLRVDLVMKTFTARTDRDYLEVARLKRQLRKIDPKCLRSKLLAQEIRSLSKLLAPPVVAKRDRPIAMPRRERKRPEVKKPKIGEPTLKPPLDLDNGKSNEVGSSRRDHRPAREVPAIVDPLNALKEQAKVTVQQKQDELQKMFELV